MRNDVAALLEPPPLGQRPELVEAGAVQLNLGLLPREPRAALRGEQQPIALAANPHFAFGADRQVTLFDLIGLHPAEIRRRVHQELALDLHSDTVDSRMDPTGGLAGRAG